MLLVSYEWGIHAVFGIKNKLFFLLSVFQNIASLVCMYVMLMLLNIKCPVLCSELIVS